MEMPTAAYQTAGARLDICSGAALCILFICIIQNGYADSTASPPSAPWERPRNLADFQSLLQHSPFTLPTAEESSPLAERYALTGIVTLGGVEEIFVFDRTDQSREMLTRTLNSKNMSLVALVREGNALPQKATIRVGNETGTISYLEATPQQQLQPAALQAPASPTAVRALGVQLPPLPQPPGAINTAQSPSVTSQSHRIIRRSMVAPPQP